MIAGPYKSNTDDPNQWHKNLSLLNRAALSVLRKGHTPIIGVNMALPIIAEAGESEYRSIMMPLSLGLAKRCDAILRIGGDSAGADQEVELVKSIGGKVFYSLEDIPNLD